MLNHIFVLSILVLISYSSMFSQETVYIESRVSQGKGVLKSRPGECFVITPLHVAASGTGKFTIVGQRNVVSEGEFVQGFSRDLALIRIVSGGQQTCEEWNVPKNFTDLIANTQEGYLEYKNELGATRLIRVYFSEKDEDMITIRPLNRQESFVKGMSGASLFSTIESKKVYLGMLQSIDPSSGEGYVFQADDLERILGGFFDQLEVVTPTSTGLSDIDECGCTNQRIFNNAVHDYLKTNYKSAYNTFTLLEDVGCTTCLYFLGRMFFKGEGIEKDDLRAEEYFNEAIKKGDMKGYYGLGNMAYGNDKSRADFYFSNAYKSMVKCAGSGSPFWKTNLAFMYMNGMGVPLDYDKAEELLLEVVDIGYGRAHFMLGSIYHNYEKKKNIESAIYWYEKTTKENLFEGQAELQLGNIYASVDRFKDINKSLEFYLKSANKGNEHAQYNLGDFYFSGKGVSKDYQKAILWFKKAADQNNGNALNYLGYMYSQGYGVPKSENKALEYYKEACSNGSEIAFSNIGGIMIRNKKYKEGLEWLMKGAQINNTRSQLFLGLLYERSDFENHDYIQSYIGIS